MHQTHVYAVTHKVIPLESPKQGVVHGNNMMAFIYQGQCKIQALCQIKRECMRSPAEFYLSLHGSSTVVEFMDL